MTALIENSARSVRGELHIGPARWIGACLVIAAHVVMIVMLTRYQLEPRRVRLNAEPMIAEIYAAEPSETLVEGLQFVTVDQPIEFALPELPITSEPELAIDAPRIDPASPVDIAWYSARAQLARGAVATVLLLVDIAQDGSVASARVVRSDAGDAANAAAISYAHATRWTPGMVGGEPRAMQASLTVILGERG